MFEKFHRFHLSQCLLCFLTVCLVLSFFSPASAHPGGTDEYGGHYNRSTGEYHYHHGYPAHQHINGTCPYDFDDRTGWNSGSSSGSSGDSSGDSSGSFPSVSAVPDSNVSASDSRISVHPLLLIFGALVSIQILRIFFTHRKVRRQKEQEEKLRMERFRAEQDKLRNLYEGKKLSELVPPPVAGDHIGSDGLPCGHGPEPWGSTYTVFVTSGKSRVFHRQKFCSCTMGRPVNIVQVPWHRPCLKCYRVDPPDLAWYHKQKKILDLCKSYDISLTPDDTVHD